MNDVIWESSGKSTINGGFGDDTIHLTVGGEGDVVIGGVGVDTIIVENEIGDVVLSQHCFPLRHFLLPLCFPVQPTIKSSSEAQNTPVGNLNLTVIRSQR